MWLTQLRGASGVDRHDDPYATFLPGLSPNVLWFALNVACMSAIQLPSLQAS